jgi:hypothetical protein
MPAGGRADPFQLIIERIRLNGIVDQFLHGHVDNEQVSDTSHHQKRACDQIHRGENSARHASALARLAGARSGLFALPRARRLRRCIRTPTGEVLLDSCRRKPGERRPEPVALTCKEPVALPLVSTGRPPHAAWYAAAQLHAIKTLADDPPPSTPVLSPPLLEAVIDNAATAVRLLAPTSPRGGTSSAVPV